MTETGKINFAKAKRLLTCNNFDQKKEWAVKLYSKVMYTCIFMEGTSLPHSMLEH